MNTYSSTSEQPPLPQQPHPQIQADPWQPQPMVFVYEQYTWEYKVVLRTGDRQLKEDELNALGHDGWELAATTPSVEGIRFFFKRLSSR